LESRAWIACPITAILVLLIVSSVGCGTATNDPAIPSAPKIQLTGDVKYNFTYSPVPMSNGYAEYHIDIRLRNTGGASYIFDKAIGEFINVEGKSLKSVMTNIEKGVYEIKAGGEQTLEFGTDGYTPDLVFDAPSGPLVFQITLYTDEKMVFGPQTTVLPDLLGLMKDDKTIALTFQ
jgi:hypothetical protein